MKLDTEFYQLPLRFDADLLKKEIAQFTEAEWQPHPQGFPGNSALLLVAANGNPRDNALKGHMQPTPHLQRCPYLRQVMASFQTVIGRTRLMRLGPEAEVTPHTDANYYWQQRVRVHVPIVTYPEVEFLCGDKSVHMGEGETWIFDTSKIHNVINPTPHTRIHLVSDTVGTKEFWDLVDQSNISFDKPYFGSKQAKFIPYNPELNAQLKTERFNAPIVMSPWEQEYFINLFWESFWSTDNKQSETVESLEKLLNDFKREWLGLWAQYRIQREGFPEYQAALKKFEQQLEEFSDTHLRINNGIGVVVTIKQLLIFPALNPDLIDNRETVSIPTQVEPKEEIQLEPIQQFAEPKSPAKEPKEISSVASKKGFDRPIFIVAAPRSGSTFLFETLMRSPNLLTIGDESHGIFENIPALHPAQRKYDSNCLNAEDVTPEIAAMIKQGFLAKLKDHQGQAVSAPQSAFRFLEKTPKNALRIPFLNVIFPDALFIYLYRDPHENISSIIEAWQSGRFVTYRDLPGWTGKPWSLLLIPEWRRLKKKTLPKIAAAQWERTHQQILQDFQQIASERCCGVHYTDLVNNPQREIERLCQFAGIDWQEDLEANDLPLSKFTVTPPDPNKWKKHASALKPLLPTLATTTKKATQYLEKITQVKVVDTLSKTPAIAKPSSQNVEPDPHEEEWLVPEEKYHLQPTPLLCESSGNFAEILHQLKTSLVISNPADNRLATLFSDKTTLKAQYREFNKPMAFTIDQSLLSIATQSQISHFRNMAAVARKLEPIGFYDACYLHRKSHVTAELFIEDLAYAKQELWGVSSRFSCLFTLDAPHSFMPRWRPSFLKQLTPTDVCHLNGLAIADNLPKYVTALAATDTPQGWRNTGLDQGIIMDVASNEILVTGLKQPKSPRWYDQRLWVLEAATGLLATVDLQLGKLAAIAKIPGFLNSLCFVGNYAFVAASRLPESLNASSGIWVVDIHTGEIVAHSLFTEVTDIFTLQAIPNVLRPDITNFDEMLLGSSYALSDNALKDIKLH